MAIVTSNEYDHIDVVNGSNTNRHYIKDTTARNNIEDLKSAFTSDIEQITGNVPVIFTKNAYYRFTNQGANVSLTPTALADRAGACVPCSPGDKFIVNVTGGGAVVLAYGFCDANGIVKDRATTNQALNGDVLTAPADSAYAVFNNMTSTRPNYSVIKGSVLLKDNVDQLGGVSASNYNYLLVNVDINVRANYTSSSGWTDTPTGIANFFFINHHMNVATDAQFIIAHADGTIYNRIVYRSNREVYRNWKTGLEGLETEVANLKDAVDTLGLNAATYEYKYANVDINCRGNFSSSSGWTDAPTDPAGVFINHHVNTIFNIQYFITHADGTIYNRIVRRSNHVIVRDWTTQGVDVVDPLTLLNVVVIGDSICRGGRNSGKGFIGDVGCNYVNLGVGSATISNKRDSSSTTDTANFIGAANIPDQIVKYAQQTSESWYIIPDAIIAEGGINDMAVADLGTIPTQPIHNDTEAAQIDQSTLVGGLQYMFYQMIKLYPLAHRYFLISNRVNTRPWTPNTGETIGYTQTQMADAIKAVCKLYNVEVINIFDDSPLDSYFSQYVSPAAYNTDHNLTNLYCIDSDKLHPMALGYKVGYVPYVKKALQSAIDGVDNAMRVPYTP